MPLTIGLAPDSFKGTLTAPQAAQAMAAGARRALPDATVLRLPMADGGEGTAALLARATGGYPETRRARDPLWRPVEATLYVLGDNRTWAVDVAAASGLTRLAPDERNPLRACSAGTGELIRAAAEAGAETVVLGLGGSATVDGGTGLCRALGVRWLDDAGQELPPGGGALSRLASVDTRGLARAVRRLRLRVAHDVQNPLLGPEGAAAVFGPQKGADAAGVQQLEAGLTRLAEVLKRPDLISRPGMGAAGGIGLSLRVLLDAQLEPGAPLVWEQAVWSALLPRCDVVVVAEGRLDAQTAAGKAPAHVAAEAARAGIPALAVAGSLGPGARDLPHLTDLEPLYTTAPDPLPTPGEAATRLCDATARLLARFSA